MNILPKKSWHVFSHENLAIYEADEKKHREELEKVEQQRIAAEKEARWETLQRRVRHAGLVPFGCPELIDD